MCLPSRASEKNETATFHASPRQRHVWGASLALKHLEIISRNLLRPTTDRSLTETRTAPRTRRRSSRAPPRARAARHCIGMAAPAYSTDDTVLWPHFSAAHAQGDAFHGRRPLPLQ